MKNTDEGIVAVGLLKFFLSRPEVVVHAWHPPSGKAYFGPLIPIPKILGGGITRERYHLDGLVQIGKLLLLLELKGNSADLHTDVTKLKELVQNYDVESLKRVMMLRVHEKEHLASVSAMIPAFGYRVDNGHQPTNGCIFQVSDLDSPVTIGISGDVPIALQDIIKHGLID